MGPLDSIKIAREFVEIEDCIPPKLVDCDNIVEKLIQVFKELIFMLGKFLMDN